MSAVLEDVLEEIPSKRAKIAYGVAYEGWSRWGGNGGQKAESGMQRGLAMNGPVT
jgi:hypothetical protein